MPRSPKAINPSLPVFKKADIIAQAAHFNIVRVGQFTSPKFGPTWRLTVVFPDGGETGLILFTGNEVRDDEFGAFAEAIAKGDTVGPCALVSVPSATKGHSARYDIVEPSDVPEDGTAAFAAATKKS